MTSGPSGQSEDFSESMDFSPLGWLTSAPPESSGRHSGTPLQEKIGDAVRDSEYTVDTSFGVEMRRASGGLKIGYDNCLSMLGMDVDGD